MDFSQIRDKYVPVLRPYVVPIALGFLGLMFLGYGVISTLPRNVENKDILSDAATDESPSVKKLSVPAIGLAIDVEGAVLKPGVYKLEKDSRVQDALIAAGGMSEKADRSKITKSMNMAAKLVDGGKIYIPFTGDIAAVAGVNTQNTSASSLDSGGRVGLVDSVSGVININTATEQELDSLPGVGTITAARIINNRPYGGIEELLSKKVVGQSVYNKIKDKIALD